MGARYPARGQAFSSHLSRGGSEGHSVSIPASPALAGATVAAQAMVFDPASPNGIAALSNAAVATFY